MAKKEETPAGAPLWMCTFGDMMSLLLCFFILLFALSTMEIKKLIEASGSLRAAFGGEPAPELVETIPDKQTRQILSRRVQLERRESYAKDELRREEDLKVKSRNLQHVIQVTGTEQGITFRLSGDTIFDPGSIELNAEAFVALRFIADELIRFPSNPVKIDGHTDNLPSRSPNGNWELSADRAYAVMRYLIEYGSPISGQVAEDRFTYESFAEHKPLRESLVDPNTAIGRAMNRRVDITLLQTDEGNGTYFEDPNAKNPRSPMVNPFPRK